MLLPEERGGQEFFIRGIVGMSPAVPLCEFRRLKAYRVIILPLEVRFLWYREKPLDFCG